MNDSRTLARMTLMAVAGLLILLWLRETPRPYIGALQYRFEGQEWQQARHPLSVRGQTKYMDIELSMILARWQSRTLRVKPDDCLEELSINDQTVEIPELPYCDYTRPGKKLDLSDYLTTGTNRWKMRIRDTGGDMGIRITPTLGGWVLGIDLAIALLLTLYGTLLWKRFTFVRALGGVFFLCIGGIVLRTFYVLATPYEVRGHDTGGHVDYIEYLFTHSSIPPAHQGWEYHQAPLYYIASSILMHIGSMFGMAKAQTMGFIQAQSLILSIGFVVIALLISLLLFPKKSAGTERALYCGIIGLLPAGVFLSGRITNNTLYMFLAALCILLLFRWWKSNETAHWYQLCIALGLTLLTKISGLAFVAAAGLCYLFRNGKKLSLWRHAILGGVLILLIFGWYPLLRLQNEADTQKLVKLGNIGMHGGLRLDNTKSNFFTFNPAGIVQHPFNNPWGDEQRRQYFWEYFYRSAYFGEFGFDDDLQFLARSMLIFGMAGLLLMAIGILGSPFSKDRYTVPALTCLLMLLLAAFCYRFFFPYSANQDFRQSIVVIFPATYFAVRGFSMVRSWIGGRWLQKVMLWVFVTGMVLNTTFIVLLYWYR